MPDTLERRILARAALRLNARSGYRNLPALIFLTDDERVPDPLLAIAALPCNSLVIVRARDGHRRREIARAAARIAQRRGLWLSIAGDAALAAETAADGLHLAEADTQKAPHHLSTHRGWFITAAAHSARAVWRAQTAGVHAVLLSPVFATQSHPGRPPLGLGRLGAIARASRIPVYAMGGITAENVDRLKHIPLAGIAAIGALIPSP